MRLNRTTLLEAGFLPVIKIHNMSNITQIINTDKNLKILKKGVHGSDMDQLLSSTGPFTLFAPSDMAFDKLEKGLMEEMLEPNNRLKLAELIKNHVVNGKILFNELKEGDKLTTISGREMQVKVNEGQVSIDDIMVHEKLGKISNGVIHLLDTVLTGKQ